MIRIVNDRIEIYFLQKNVISGKEEEIELVFTTELYLLIAKDARTLEGLRTRLLMEAERVSLKPKPSGKWNAKQGETVTDGESGRSHTTLEWAKQRGVPIAKSAYRGER